MERGFEVQKTFPMTTELDDRSQMPFGKYQGKAMANVPAHYLLWLYNNGCNHAGVKKYIIDNLTILKNETDSSFNKQR